jgi:hypothetical protein
MARIWMDCGYEPRMRRRSPFTLAARTLILRLALIAVLVYVAIRVGWMR